MVPRDESTIACTEGPHHTPVDARRPPLPRRQDCRKPP